MTIKAENGTTPEQLELELRRAEYHPTEDRLRERLKAIRMQIDNNADATHAMYVLLEEMVDVMFTPVIYTESE